MVSIIIACLNSGGTLKQALDSVFGQSYKDLEAIVIDGGSSDQTIEILRSFDQRLKVKSPAHIPPRREASVGRKKLKFFWKSEKDRGIADAFNKGVRMAHGDYIYFLGADDVLKHPNVIERMMKGVDPKKDLIICGKIDRITLSKKYSVLYTSSIRFHPLLFLYKMTLPHQGIFMHRKFFQLYGLFDTQYKYAMDYDLLLRAYHEFPRVILKDIVVAGWREGGIGKNKLYEILDEYHRIRMKNHIAPAWILRIIHEIVKARYRLVGL